MEKIWQDIGLGVIIGLGLSSPFWPWLLAHFNIFFTFVKEGEAKIVVNGESYVKTILSLKDYVVAKDGTIVAKKRPRGIFTWLFGVYWIGIAPFRKIYRYDLRWMAYQPKADNSGEKEAVVKNKTLSSTFVKDKVYYGLAKEVETTEGLPLNIEFLVTLRVINPYKAIFLINNWVEAIIDRTTQQTRVYIGTKEYMELLQKETSNPREGFSGYMADALGQTIRDAYGVEFVSCDILSVNPIDNTYQEATTKLYIAQRTAAAKVAAAEAEATAIKKVGQAEADVIEAKGKAEAKALDSRISAYQKSPAASKTILSADVGRAQSVGSIAQAIGKGLGLNKEVK